MKKRSISILALVSTMGILLILIFLGGCVPAAEGEGGSLGVLPLIVLVLLFFAMLYFLMIRPIRQREKKHDRMVLQLEKGDTVITAGGVYGEVDRVDEDSVVLKVESGAKIRVTKGGVLTNQTRGIKVE